MRDIKFRGKSLKTGEWVYGDLVRGEKETYIAPEEILLVKTFVEVDPETVGRYTGLKDKNGVEIYEGDICSRVYTNGQSRCITIKWSKIRTGWQLTTRDGKVARTLEVIGNIYENPELLK